MATEDDKRESAPGMLGVSPSLISSLPPTDPAILAEEAKNWAQRQHYSAIGRVAANWSYYEAVVDICSIRLAAIDTRKGLIFTSQIAGIVRKLDVYISLARIERSLVARWTTYVSLQIRLGDSVRDETELSMMSGTLTIQICQSVLKLAPDDYLK
jgi:hypothetical protein